MELRVYQSLTLERTYAFIAAGRRRILICLPTGGGKTVVAARFIIEQLAAGKRILFTAHRRELIRQPFCKLVRYGVDHQQIGIIMAGVRLPTGGMLPGHAPIAGTDREIWDALARRRPTAPVQIASIDSLRHLETLPDFDVIIVDEAHRALAKGYRTLLDRYPNAIVIGLSATPSRGDGKGLNAAFDEMVIAATYLELVELGFLVEPRAFIAPNLPDLARVRVVGGDYDQEQLAEAFNKEGLIGDIVATYQLRGGGAPALAFATNVEHSQRIAERFKAAGIAAAHVDGEMPSRERDRILEDLGAGRVQVVSNCDVATEGTDIPAVKCVIMARPTRSLRVMLQQAGRGSRPCGGLHRFVILDHAGNLAVHGFPQYDREWSLEGRKRRPGASGPLVWACKNCLTANPLTEVACLECGEPRPVPERRELEEHAGELVEAVPLTDADLRAGFERIVDEWRLDNARRPSPRKPGWIAFRFKERYGVNPPPGCALPELTGDERARRERHDQLKRRGEANGYDHRYAHAKLRAEAKEAPPRVIGGFLAPVTTEWST